MENGSKGEPPPMRTAASNDSLRNVLDISTRDGILHSASRSRGFHRGIGIGAAAAATEHRISMQGNRLHSSRSSVVEDRGGAELFDDVQEELDRSGHNLTSVLSNPRETVLDMLYDALDAEQAYPIESYAAGGVHEQQPVDLSSVWPFLQRTGPLTQTFYRSHANACMQPPPPNSRNASFRSIGENAGPLRPTANTDKTDAATKAALEQGLARCFAEVPAMFFDGNYTLEDDSVFEKMVNNAGPMHQERLTHYLDIVEVCLLSQISARSDAFLEGLETTHALRRHVSGACSSVLQLRRAMARVEEEVVVKAMRVPQLAQRQQNLVALQSRLELFQEVERSRAAVEALISAEDYCGALDVLEAARRTLTGELAELHCLRGVGRQLAEYEAHVAGLLSAQFLSLAQSQRQLQVIGDSEMLAVAADNEAQLSVTVAGLERVNRMGTVLDVYDLRLAEDLKLIVRTVVSDYLQTTGQSGEILDFPIFEDGVEAVNDDGGTLGVSKLKTLEHSAFLDCMSLCFEHTLAALERAAHVYRCLAKGPQNGIEGGDDSANDAAVAAAASASQYRDRGLISLKTAGELVERSVSQLISLRKDYHCTSLTPQQLRALSDSSITFAAKVESVCSTQGSKLRLTLLNQAKAYVDNRHEANKHQLVSCLDAEKWIQVDVSAERQASMSRLASGRVLVPEGGDNASTNTTLSPPHGLAGGPGPPIKSLGINNIAPAVAPETPLGARARDRKREVIIEGRSFKAVWSVLLLLEVAAAQLRLASLFPAAAPDVVSRLAELLRLFNSRTTQLVLGAGAMHSASRLKSISAKHLALCSRALALVQTLAPHMRVALAGLLPKKHHILLVEMDRVSQDFSEHHEKILAKFVSIIQEVIEQSSSTLKGTDWDRVGGTGEGTECRFMADVVKGVTAMHRVLQQQLPPEQLADVFYRIFSLLNRKIPECFSKEGVAPATAAGRQRILDDTSFMATALSTLHGVDGSSLHLEEVMRVKYGGTDNSTQATFTTGMSADSGGVT